MQVCNLGRGCVIMIICITRGEVTPGQNILGTCSLHKNSYIFGQDILLDADRFLACQWVCIALIGSRP